MTDMNRHASYSSLKQKYETGQISRRGFLQGAAAMGLLTTAAAAAKPAQAAEPKKGGKMRIGTYHGQTADNLDPALLFNGAQWMIAYAVRNTLTQIEAGATLAPCLATEWSPNANATTWVFKLRQNVEFHDGKPLTVDDVIASLNRHRGENSESAVKPIADQMKDIRADGPNTLVIDLVKPNVDFPYSLASANFTICKADGDGIDATSGIGTGGYVLKEYEPGVRAILERNPNYWRDDRAHASTVELLTIADPTARINAIMSDGVDVIDEIEFKAVSRLINVDGISVEKTQGPLHYLFSMMSDRAPFESNDVRLALKYACDREALIQKVLSGHGTIANDQPIGPSYRYHDASLEQRAYDPDKAKFHLKKAGLDSLDLNISAGAAAFGGAVDAATVLQESAKPANINITVVREPADGYWTNVYMNKPMFTNYWGGYTTSSQMFSTGYLPGAAWNESMFENDRFVEVLQQANAELDTDRRAEMIAELQALVRDEAGQLIWSFPDNILATNGKLGHNELASDRPLDGRHIIERWWVA
ncbi:MAG: ABC transporter substrate-binding protein [Alphaproteobacteria bacterium]